MSTEREIETWLAERLPAELRAAPPEALLYDDELIVVLRPLAPEAEAESGDEDGRLAREHAAIMRLREQSRALRMSVAEDLQARYERPVAWAMRVGGSEALFTARTAPVMTRLDRWEREVLDTLVAAGVAETRSAALAYCVRVFAAEHAPWLARLREVAAQMRQVRATFRPRRRAEPPLE